MASSSDTYLSAGNTQQGIVEVLVEATGIAFRAGSAEQTRMDTLIFMQATQRRLFGWGPNRVQPAGPPYNGWKMRAPHGSRVSALALRADGQLVTSQKPTLLSQKAGEKNVIGGAVVVTSANFSGMGLRVEVVRAGLMELAEALRIKF